MASWPGGDSDAGTGTDTAVAPGTAAVAAAWPTSGLRRRRRMIRWMRRAGLLRSGSAADSGRGVAGAGRGAGGTPAWRVAMSSECSLDP